MNILVVCDIKDWAIGHLAEIYTKGNPQFNFRTVYVHPKEVPRDMHFVTENLDWADIVSFEYWNSAKQLLEAIPALRDKKLTLMHHNQKNLLDYDWKDIDVHLVHTKKAQSILLNAGYKNVQIIPYGFDFDYWQYLEKYPSENVGGKFRVGYSGRVVPWKNLKLVAQVCADLDMELIFMGKMDKADYWNSIPEEQRDAMDMSFMNCPDDERKNFYYHLDAFVNMSSDGREEGTMPFMEAMACGIPVVTTASGTAADIITNGKNGLVVPFDELDGLKHALSSLRDDLELCEALRRGGWETIRNMTTTRMARRYAEVFYKLYDKNPLVSVIVPCHKVDNLNHLIDRIDHMSWPNVELVICNDAAVGTAEDNDIDNLIEQMKTFTKLPIKVVYTNFDYGPGDKTYGLAKARNLGVIEAQGEFLMFCDSRMLPAKDAINHFMDAITGAPKCWLFGDKGSAKSTFVENFSFIRRSDLIAFGMFNERIDQYGGQSQELRERMQRQGMKTGFVPDAKAEQMSGSHMTPERRRSIVEMKDLLFKLGLFR